VIDSHPGLYSRFSQHSSLLEDIRKAVNGEYGAIVCYERIAGMAPDAETRNRILEIRNDEIRHFQRFSQLYYRLSGIHPKPVLSEPCPAEYRAALRFAFQDEQETVDFYHEIADRAGHTDIGHAFRRAAADEQNHAVWFLSWLVSR